MPISSAPIDAPQNLNGIPQPGEAPKEMSAFFDAIIQAFDGFIYLCSENYEVEFMNQRLIERTGHNPTGQKCYQVLHDRREKCPWCVNDRVFRGETVDWEVLSPKDNRWYRAINSLVHHPDGRKLKMSLITDITERKQSEEAYRSLIFHSPIGIYIVQDRVFKLLNPGFLSITGYAEEDFLGKDCLTFVPPEHKEFVRQNAIQMLKGQRSLPYEYPVIVRGGETVWIIETITSTTHQGKRATLGYFRDITRRKRAEEALRQAHDELELRVEQRTAELNESNRQLKLEIAERHRAEELLERQAQELARSNEELQNFAYIASHDLQEPLRKITAFGDRLLVKEATNLTALGKDYLSRMQNASARMGQLIEDLLVFSRVTTKAQPFRKVDLNEVVNEVLVDLEERSARLGADIEVGHLPVVEAEPTQVRQLFQNILANALKFHREGVSPVIFIESHIVKQSFCEIRVSDNGIGINEKYFDRIFKPFQRLHGRGVYEGTGIGLAICDKIIARHGGTITVASIPEKGTTFTITIPLLQPKKENSHGGEPEAH